MSGRRVYIVNRAERIGVGVRPPWLADVAMAWSAFRAQSSDSVTERRIAKSKDNVHGAAADEPARSSLA